MNKEPIIFVTERGNVSLKYLKELKEVGVTVVVAKDPTKVKLIKPTYEVSGGSPMLLAAMRAIEGATSSQVRDTFAEYLAQDYIKSHQSSAEGD